MHYGPDARSAWLDVDWREHQRWVQVAGAPVNVIDLGEGDPMVFIHGLSGSWVNWLENLPHFARSHRVIAMDLPGFGHSPMPADEISIAGYGRIVDELLTALDAERAVIVGNSMGGFIGAEVAIQFLTRVEKLVLISAAGLSIEHQRNEPALRLLERLDNVLIFTGGWAATRSETLTRRPKMRRQLMKLVADRAEALPAPLIAEQIKGSGKPGFVPALDALSDYPIRDRLGEIECPVLVVWGEKDRLVPVRDAYEFGRLIPQARVVVWPDTGHVAMLERPAAFNALVDEFLAQ
jgi:pimeloyl-ACP methyl ester carboxylesterase